MNEDFIHYVWKNKLYNSSGLATTEGEKIIVIKPGFHNRNAGPDFTDCRIKIGETHWAGNIEIHLRSSDWIAHNHQQDPAYSNVVLHVVYEHDKDVLNSHGKSIPTLELKQIIDPQLFAKVQHTFTLNEKLPCASLLKGVRSITITGLIERMAVDRLIEKQDQIIKKLIINQNNWEETFYHQLAESFGFKVNNLPFLLLARSIDSRIFAKHKNSLVQIEALLFGQAGFLEDTFDHPYPKQLQNEYEHLRKKYQLIPIEKHLWKYLRLRPANFPTLRIAQFAQLIYQSSHLLSRVIELTDQPKRIEGLFKVTCSEFWDEHYDFVSKSPNQKKHLGKASIDLLLINTIAPFIFCYGKQKLQEKYCDAAFAILANIKAEDNSIIKEFKPLLPEITNAYETQGLLQLKKHWCDKKQCLSCSAGNEILSGILKN